MAIKRITTVAVLAVVGIVIITTLTWDTSRNESIASASKPETTSIITAGNNPDVEAAIVAAQDAWYADQQRQIDEYLSWQHDQDVALWVATHQPPPVQRFTAPTASLVPTDVSGDCAPVAAIIGWTIVNRESGGNPGARNSSSGAFGCSQTLPSHYNPGGACAGMDMYSVEGQTACTQSLYDRGGLNPWRLTAG